MAKSSGKNGLLMIGTTTANMVAVAETKSTQASASKDMLDATPQGVDFKQYIPDVSDYSLKLSKFFDNAYFALADAAIAGTVLQHRWYPDRASTGIYWGGAVYTSMDTMGGGVGDVNMEEHTIQPAGVITYTHP